MAGMGHNGAMAADDFRGVAFTGSDFTGATFRDCDLRKVKISDCWLTDVKVDGLVGNFIVNGVDVTAFVNAELDRQFPERARVREMRTAGDYRAMWDTIETLWADTVSRAMRLPEPSLRQQVDDEWSFVETMRHLVFATDAWAGRAIAGEPAPYHPLGLPASGFPAADSMALGLDLGAQPPLSKVMEVRRGRMAQVRGIVDGLTDADLDRVCPRRPSPVHPEETRTVGTCLRVIMKEECEHRRYVVRDLTVLEGS
jgi:hypothetical protein